MSERTIKRNIRVSSAKRDLKLYPSSAAYRIGAGSLGSFARIKEIRLTDYTIPNSIYNITENNNTLRLTIGGMNYTLTLIPGSYNPSTLAAQIMAAAADAMTSLTVTYSSTLGKYRLEVDEMAGISVLGGSAAATLGFRSVPVSGDTDIIGDSMIDLSRAPNIFIRLNNLSMPGTEGHFAMIQNAADFGDLNIGSFHHRRDMCPLWRSDSGIAAPTELEISFVDEWGRPIDFNGLDHMLELEFAGH